MKIEDSEK